VTSKASHDDKSEPAFSFLFLPDARLNLMLRTTLASRNYTLGIYYALMLCGENREAFPSSDPGNSFSFNFTALV